MQQKYWIWATEALAREAANAQLYDGIGLDSKYLYNFNKTFIYN